MSQKRVKRATIAFHAHLPNLRKSESLNWSKKLSCDNLLGLAQSRIQKGSLLSQILGFKQLHPNQIILTRVGEFYEIVGVDAVMVTEATENLPTADGKIHIKACRIQKILTSLLRQDLSCAVYEESSVICTPKERYLSQIVTMATPIYNFASGEELHEDDLLIAKPVAILKSDGACISIGLVNVQEECYWSYYNVDQSTASCLLSDTFRPVYIIGRAPSWCTFETKELGANSVCTPIQRLLDHIEGTFHIKTAAQFRSCPLRQDACSMLSKFTTVQLGLTGNDMGVPSLAEACLPRACSRIIVDNMKRWLICPPIRSVALMRQQILRDGLGRCVPSFNVTRAGQRIRCLQNAPAVSPSVLLAIRHNMKQLKKVASWEDVAQVTAAQLGFEFSLRIDKVISILDSYLEDLSYTVGTTSLHIRHDMLEDHIRTYETRIQELNQFLEKYDAGETTRDFRGFVVLRGRVGGGEGRLRVKDKSGRELPNLYSTQEIKCLNEAVEVAREELVSCEQEHLQECTKKLRDEFLKDIWIAEQMSLDLTTLYEHAIFVAHSGWSIAKTSNTFSCEQVLPYWMTGGIGNSCVIRDTTVLTAPNGGGKTTLLRTIASVALLHQCGLCVPCSSATVPEYDHIFLRAGALDCASEHRSAFANEMLDMRLMLEASGNVLLLVDEPCRGTSTADGVSLLKAIIESFSTNITAIVSTHYHELESSAEHVKFMQLGVRTNGYKCVPDFKLTKGKCVDSMALRIAISAGIPLSIINAARQPDDELTLVLALLHEKGMSYEAMPDGFRPPPAWTNNVYILDTTEGFYVGESERFHKRILVQKNRLNVRNSFLIQCENKSVARSREALIIQDLQNRSVRLVSSCDGNHSI